MFNQLVIIEPINMLDIHIKKLNEIAKKVIIYDTIPKDDEEILKRIEGADAILLSYTSKIDEYVLKKQKNLKYIGMCCSLYSYESANVDILCANKLNITVKGIRDYGDNGVCEYIIWQLVEFLEGYKELKWDKYPHEITGLKCGIVGLGTSGTMIAKTLKFFHADVSYYSRTRKKEIEEEFGFTYKDLNTLCKESDAIFLALNKNVLLLNEEQFNLMEGRRILFNTSIGPGFDPKALKKWLDSSNHFFFGDTLATIGDLSLWDKTNTYTINRSSGGKCYEAYFRLGEKVLDNIYEYQKNNLSKN